MIGHLVHYLVMLNYKYGLLKWQGSHQQHHNHRPTQGNKNLIEIQTTTNSSSVLDDSDCEEEIVIGKLSFVLDQNCRILDFVRFQVVYVLLCVFLYRRGTGYQRLRL
jgi:hypothetical protein